MVNVKFNAYTSVLIVFFSHCKIVPQIIFVLHSIIALKASGRDCTNNIEPLHKTGVLQCYDMQLFVFTRELLQAIRWRSKYNGCTQRI